MKCKKGQKIKKGRCVRVKSTKRNVTNNNPFKMGGSWVGALIFGFIAYSFGSLCKVFGSCMAYKTILLILIGAGIGFLAGWGIHILVRRMKK